MQPFDRKRVQALRKRRYRLSSAYKDSLLRQRFDSKHRWRLFKQQASRRHLLIAIDYDTFAETTAKECFYCGRFSDGAGTDCEDATQSGCLDALDPKATARCHFTGIDRMDNAVGYETQNIVPCCKSCNYMKGTQSLDEFLRGVNATALRFGRKLGKEERKNNLYLLIIVPTQFALSMQLRLCTWCRDELVKSSGSLSMRVN